MSTVSLLIPIYYKESSDVLMKCFESIASQTKLPEEIVCVLDYPSSNEIEKTLNTIISKEKLNIIRVYCERGQGLGCVLKKGVENCNCDYIARMDIDDIAVPTRLERQSVFLDNNSVDVCGSNIAEFDDSIDTVIAYRKVPEQDTACKKMLKRRDPINHMTAMYRRKSILKAGNYDSNMKSCEDTCLWVAFYVNDLKFANIQDVLVYAHAGKNMYKRRSGKKAFSYVSKSIQYKKEVGLITNLECLYQRILNYIILVLLPNSFRALIYESFLRVKK